MKVLKLLGYSLVILYIGLWIGMLYTENTQPKLEDYTEKIGTDLYRIKHNTVLSKYIKYGKYCLAVYDRVEGEVIVYEVDFDEWILYNVGDYY